MGTSGQGWRRDFRSLRFVGAAVSLLPGLANPSRRVLKVETYNGEPALSTAAEPWLSDLGFVRDPPGMAFYLGWS